MELAIGDALPSATGRGEGVETLLKRRNRLRTRAVCRR